MYRAIFLSESGLKDHERSPEPRTGPACSIQQGRKEDNIRLEGLTYAGVFQEIQTEHFRMDDIFLSDPFFSMRE